MIFFSCLISSFLALTFWFFRRSLLLCFWLLFGWVGLLVCIDKPLIPTKRILNLKFLQPVSLLFLFLEEAEDACLPLLWSLVISLGILGWSEHLARRSEFPVAIAMFESVPVWILHDMHIELTAKHQVIVHCLCSNLSDLALGKLKEGISTRPSSLDRAWHAQFRDLTELLEEILELGFVEALGQMADVKDSPIVIGGHLEFVEPSR